MLSQVLSFDERKPLKGFKRGDGGCGIQKQYGK
jgi:hypothetical protein